MPEHNRLTEAEYTAALARFQRAIADGMPLAMDDSEEPGDKYVDCSWGLCSMDAGMWPFEHRAATLRMGRVIPKDPPRGARCPMDTRPPGAHDFNGCFWTCRMFRPTKEHPRPNRAEALRLYDLALARTAPPPSPLPEDPTNATP